MHYGELENRECEVRRLKLALVGVEDKADVKQQSTKGQKNEKKINKNDTWSGFPL